MFIRNYSKYFPYDALSKVIASNLGNPLEHPPYEKRSAYIIPGSPSNAITPSCFPNAIINSLCVFSSKPRRGVGACIWKMSFDHLPLRLLNSFLESDHIDDRSCVTSYKKQAGRGVMVWTRNCLLVIIPRCVDESSWLASVCYMWVGWLKRLISFASGFNGHTLWTSSAHTRGPESSSSMSDVVSNCIFSLRFG